MRVLILIIALLLSSYSEWALSGLSESCPYGIKRNPNKYGPYPGVDCGRISSELASTGEWVIGGCSSVYEEWPGLDEPRYVGEAFEAIPVKLCGNVDSDSRGEDGCYPGDGCDEDNQSCESPGGSTFQLDADLSCGDYCEGPSVSLDASSIPPSVVATGSIHRCGSNPEGYEGDRLGEPGSHDDKDDEGDQGGDQGDGSQVDQIGGDDGDQSGGGDTGSGTGGNGGSGSGGSGSDGIETNHPPGEGGCLLGFEPDAGGNCFKDSCDPGEYDTGAGCDPIVCTDGTLPNSLGYCDGTSSDDSSDQPKPADPDDKDDNNGCDPGWEYDSGLGACWPPGTKPDSKPDETPDDKTDDDQKPGDTPDSDKPSDNPGSGNGTGTGNGDGAGSGTSNGDGNGTGNGDGNGTGSGDGNGTGNGDGKGEGGDCDATKTDYLDCLEIGDAGDKFKQFNSLQGRIDGARQQYQDKAKQTLEKFKEKIKIQASSGSPFFSDTQDVFGVPVDFGTTIFKDFLQYLPALVLFLASVYSGFTILGGYRS